MHRLKGRLVAEVSGAKISENNDLGPLFALCRYFGFTQVLLPPTFKLLNTGAPDTFVLTQRLEARLGNPNAFRDSSRLGFVSASSGAANGRLGLAKGKY